MTKPHRLLAGGTPAPQWRRTALTKERTCFNSYCVNILGNWDTCGNCHVGLGQPPTPDATPEQLANIDCMVCHQEAYRRKKVNGAFVPDENAMTISMDQAARMDLQGELGYALKGPQSQVCCQCHGSKDNKSFTELHNKHVKDKRYDRSWCHSFSRPERGLRFP